MSLPLKGGGWSETALLIHDSGLDYDRLTPIERGASVMSIFGDIMSAIFGSSAKAETPAAGTQAPAAKPAAASPSSSPSATSAPSVSAAPSKPAVPAQAVDVAAVLDARRQEQQAEAQLAHIDRRSDEAARARQRQGGPQEARRGAALHRRYQARAR